MMAIVGRKKGKSQEDMFYRAMALGAALERFR